MKVFVALAVVGLAMAAGNTAVAQDAFYRYDSNAHSYHNWHYPVDGVGHYHHSCYPKVTTTPEAVVYYRPVDLHHGCHGYHGCGHHHGGHLIDISLLGGLVWYQLF